MSAVPSLFDVSRAGLVACPPVERSCLARAATVWEPIAPLYALVATWLDALGCRALPLERLEDAVDLDTRWSILYASSTSLPTVLALVRRGTKVMVLQDPDMNVPVRMLARAGVTAVVPRGCRRNVFVSAIELGEVGMRAFPDQPYDERQQSRAMATALLTADERAWLTAASRGMPMSEIALASCVSERTLMRRLAKLYERLGVNSLSGALVAVADNGVSLE